MSAILFSPHNDDETLFAFYQVLRHKPKVVVVYRSFKEAQNGGPKHPVREAETAAAMAVAGVEWEQWEYRDNANRISPGRHILDAARGYDIIIAPAYEEGGHEQHNDIADVLHDHHLKAHKAKKAKVVRYLTYKRGHGRSDEGVEIIPTDEEKALKAQALACYPSQAAYGPTAYWFGADQREFVLPL